MLAELTGLGAIEAGRIDCPGDDVLGERGELVGARRELEAAACWHRR